MLIVVYFYNMDTVQYMKTQGRLSSFHSLKYLLTIGLLLLIFLKADAQRTVEFFEPDYDSSYCVHSILFESLKNDPAYPVHYNQFFSATAKEKKIRKIEKTVTNRVSILKEITEFNEDGYIISRDLEKRNRVNYYSSEGKKTIHINTLLQHIRENYFYYNGHDSIKLKKNEKGIKISGLSRFGNWDISDSIIYEGGENYIFSNKFYYQFNLLKLIKHTTVKYKNSYSYTYDSINRLHTISEIDRNAGNWESCYRIKYDSNFLGKFTHFGDSFNNSEIKFESWNDPKMSKIGIVVTIYSLKNKLTEPTQKYSFIRNEDKRDSMFIIQLDSLLYMKKIIAAKKFDGSDMISFDLIDKKYFFLFNEKLQYWSRNTYMYSNILPDLPAVGMKISYTDPLYIYDLNGMPIGRFDKYIKCVDSVYNFGDSTTYKYFK